MFMSNALSLSTQTVRIQAIQVFKQYELVIDKCSTWMSG